MPEEEPISNQERLRAKLRQLILMRWLLAAFRKVY